MNWIGIYFQAMFISDLISDLLMIINHNFRGSRDKQRRSVFKWPELDLSTHERGTCMEFISIITYSRVMIPHSIGLNRRDISKLGNIRHNLQSEPFYLPNEKCIIDNVIFKNESLFLQALRNNKYICVAYGSFHLDKLHLISATWFASMHRKVIAFGDFT